jgi:hypothetical protein
MKARQVRRPRRGLAVALNILIPMLRTATFVAALLCATVAVMLMIHAEP